MSVYSDTNIIELIAMGGLFETEIPEDHIQPASVDLTLADGYLPLQESLHRNPPTYSIKDKSFIGFSPEDTTRILCECEHKGPYVLRPGCTVLVSTHEVLRIPNNVRGVIYNKSSLARVGLSVCSDAGFLDPGFRGQVTLDLHNHGTAPIMLDPGVKICQVEFAALSSASTRPYGSPGRGSSYQDQRGATAARNNAA